MDCFANVGCRVAAFEKFASSDSVDIKSDMFIGLLDGTGIVSSNVVRRSVDVGRGEIVEVRLETDGDNLTMVWQLTHGSEIVVDWCFAVTSGTSPAPVSSNTGRATISDIFFPSATEIDEG